VRCAQVSWTLPQHSKKLQIRFEKIRFEFYFYLTSSNLFLHNKTHINTHFMRVCASFYVYALETVNYFHQNIEFVF
jgi:hypothetical protein